MDLVNAVVPKWTEAERLDAYARTLRALNRVGLTGAHVMVGTPELLDDVRALEAARRPDAADGRADAPGAGDQRRGGRAAARGRRRARPAVARRDGQVLPRRRARVRHRVAARARAGRRERAPFWPSVERYAELVRRFTAAGFSVTTHAVGDGAVHGALDAYEAAGPPARGMHRVEHIETLVDSDLPRFAALNVAASMQPLHMEGLDDPGAPSAWVDGLSAGRYERGFRSGDLAASGAVLALGSDWMVADYDPRVGMAWARLRRAPGRPRSRAVPAGPGAERRADAARLHDRGGEGRRRRHGPAARRVAAPTSRRSPPTRSRSPPTSCPTCRCG